MKPSSVLLGPVLLTILCSAALGQSLVPLRTFDPDRDRAEMPDRGAVAARRISCPNAEVSPVRPANAPTLTGPRLGFDREFGGAGRPMTGSEIRIVKHAVSVRIVEGVAVTRIDQTFRNGSASAVEGIYSCPLPTRAVVQGFSIFMEGKEVQASVMELTKAREVYDRITRRRSDPGIVELAARGRPGIHTRVFPIPARGEMRVTTSYAHVLARRNGRYGTAVHLESIAGQRVPEASFEVDVRSAWPTRLGFTRGFPFRARESGDESVATAGFDAEDFRARRSLEIECLSVQEEPAVTLRVHTAADGKRTFMAVIAAGARTLRGPELTLEGVATAHVYPAKLRELRKGRIAHVFGRIEDAGDPVAVLRARVGREPVEARAVAVPEEGSFVAGMWAAGRVHEILANRRGTKPSRDEIKKVIELSVSHGVLTRYTALLAK